VSQLLVAVRSLLSLCSFLAVRRSDRKGCGSLWHSAAPYEDKPGFDVFGQPIRPLHFELCECVNCQRPVPATRYRPLLLLIIVVVVVVVVVVFSLFPVRTESIFVFFALLRFLVVLA
jgi:hypothetical protein